MANDGTDQGVAEIYDDRRVSFDTTRLPGRCIDWITDRLEDKLSEGSPEKGGWINFYREMISGEAPHSVQADKKGIALGRFIVENVDLAKQLEETRKKFNQDDNDIECHRKDNNEIPAKVSITYFENWASTMTSLLLHAKPTTVEQVQYLVRTANHLNVKVSNIIILKSLQKYSAIAK